MAERRICRDFFVALAFIFQTVQLVSAGVMVQPAPIPQNLTGPTPESCTADPSWLGSGAWITDCIGAVDLLYTIEVASQRYPKTDFEFLTPKAREHGGGYEPVRTPRKYVHGSFCSASAVVQCGRGAAC